MKSLESLTKLGLLFAEKSKQIIESGEPLIPVAFGVMPKGDIKIFGLAWGEDEKIEAYQALFKHVEAAGADAVITIGDARSKSVKRIPKNYVSGQLSKDKKAQECLIIGVFGKGLPARIVTIPYKRRGRKISWDKCEITDEGISGAIIPDWCKKEAS